MTHSILVALATVAVLLSWREPVVLAQAENNRCERLFKVAAERSACNSFVVMDPKSSDDELRELVSRKVYGLSAADVAEIPEESLKQRRENLERAAADAAARNNSQCERLFTADAEKSACRRLARLNVPMPDDEMRDLVSNQVYGVTFPERKEREARYELERARLKQEENERAIREAQEAKERVIREAQEANIRAQRAREVAALNAATKAKRQRLANEYERVLSRIFSTYNYIKVEIRESGDRFSLYGMHSFFSRYSFDIGPQGPMVSSWVAQRAASLREARIVRVGVRSDSGDTTYYEVP